MAVAVVAVAVVEAVDAVAAVSNGITTAVVVIVMVASVVTSSSFRLLYVLTLPIIPRRVAIVFFMFSFNVVENNVQSSAVVARVPDQPQ